MSGTIRRWSRELGRIAGAKAGRSCCCSTTRTIAPSATPRRCRLSTCPATTACSRSARRWPRSIATGAGATACSSGTKRPTRGCSARRAGEAAREGLVWIGNWGDGERERELREFLLGPARSAGLRARCPRRPLSARGAGGAARARRALSRLARRTRTRPQVFARHRATVHVPRRFYVEALPGIPDDPRVRGARLRHPAAVRARGTTPRACSVPAATILVARDGDEMTRHMRASMHDPALRASLAASGLATIRARHTCAHRARRAAGHLRPARAPGRRRSRLMRIAFYGSSLLSSLLERRRDLLSRPAVGARHAWPSTSPSTSPMPSSGRRIATSSRRTGPKSSSITATATLCARSAEAARRLTSS